MPPKRKSSGATMADKSSVTPSKRARDSPSEAFESGDGGSEVRAFPSRADRQEFAPALSLDPHASVTNTPHPYRLPIPPRREKRESEVAHARTPRTRPLSKLTARSAAVGVPGRSCPRKKLPPPPPPRLRLVRREGVGGLARSQVLPFNPYRWRSLAHLIFSRDDSGQINTDPEEKGRPWTTAQESACY